jgi:hypothetical protein
MGRPPPVSVVNKGGDWAGAAAMVAVVGVIALAMVTVVLGLGLMALAAFFGLLAWLSHERRLVVEGRMRWRDGQPAPVLLNGAPVYGAEPARRELRAIAASARAERRAWEAPPRGQQMARGAVRPPILDHPPAPPPPPGGWPRRDVDG